MESTEGRSAGNFSAPSAGGEGARFEAREWSDGGLLLFFNFGVLAIFGVGTGCGGLRVLLANFRYLMCDSLVEVYGISVSKF